MNELIEYNGCYYSGTKENPYQKLVELDDCICGKEIFVHDDCEIIAQNAFVDEEIIAVHLPKRIKKIEPCAF